MSDLVTATHAKKAPDVKAALKAGADPNVKGKSGPLLYEAIQLKSKPIVKLLLEGGAKPDVLDDKKRTALHWLADELADPNLAKLALEKGAPAEAIDDDGETALHMAFRLKTTDFAAVLLDHGVPVDLEDEEQRTPLHRMCKSKSGVMSANELAFAKWLIDRGADVNAKDDYNITPLHYAAKSSSEMANYLLERGAKITRHNGGETPLHMSIDTHAKDTALWDTLIAAGCGLEDTTGSGETALIASVTSHNPRAVAYFLKKGANKSAKDQSGKSALDYATEYKNEKIIKLLA